jgi:hypothetical protein
MTYKDYARILRKEVVSKFSIFLKADEALTEHDGFMDIALVGKMNKAYMEWQHAQMRWSGFIAFVQNSGSNWDTEINTN